MIRYNYEIAQIAAAVDALAPRWLENVKKRSNKFIRTGRYEERSPSWSAVKPIFIRLQSGKCAYCERQFETEQDSAIEHDLEHFRPKSSVSVWPPKGWHKAYNLPLGTASENGYYWLAYDLSNYAAACSVCNSPLKSNYFPIAGPRATTYCAPDRLKMEKPYLCYPIGGLDEGPEKLVTFVATTAVPVAKSGHKKRRGEIIIDFFKLNERLQLHRERARMISLLGNSLKFVEAGADVTHNKLVISDLAGNHVPHAACLRAFRRLWRSDRALAKRVHRICSKYGVAAPRKVPPRISHNDY